MLTVADEKVMLLVNQRIKVILSLSLALTLIAIIFLVSCSGSGSSSESSNDDSSGPDAGPISSNLFSACNSEEITSFAMQSLGQPFCFSYNSLGSDFVNLRWFDTANDEEDNFIKTSTSKIVVYDRTFVDYFESGFFNGVMDYTGRHGKTLDFRLADTSDGINFGANPDLSGQIPASSWIHSYLAPLTDSLGDIDANGFIQKNGAARDATHHSVGCYEY